MGRLPPPPGGVMGGELRWVPSLAEVSSKFGLNLEQHAVFMTFGLGLLDYMLDAQCAAEEPGASDELQQQRIQAARQAMRRLRARGQIVLHLGGPGGCGKSRVVQALSVFAALWGQPRAILLTAPTGAAAVVIGGRTLHSIFPRLDTRTGRSSTRAKAAVKAGETARLVQQAHMIVIDEVCMLTKEQLLTVSQSLNDAVGNAVIRRRVHGGDGDGAGAGGAEGAPVFGGLHVLAVGDAFQLRPVGGAPLPSVPTSSSSASELEGYQLWTQHVQGGIFLHRLMRADACEDLRSVLTELRNGRLADASNARLLDKLNERVLPPAGSLQLDPSERNGDGQLAVMMHNKHRAQYQWAGCVCFARRRTAYCFLAVPSTTGGNVLHESVRRRIMSCRSEKHTAGLPTCLIIGVGMPVRITANVDVEHGVANNTPGVVESIVLPLGTVITERHIAGPGGMRATVRLCDRHPLHVVVSIGGEQHYITPQTHSGLKILTDARGRLMNNCKGISLTALPMVPDYAVTVYGVQGSTLDRMLVPLWDGMTVYVAVSRVRELRHAIFQRKVTLAIARKSKPPQYTQPDGSKISAITLQKRMEQQCERTFEHLHGWFSPAKIARLNPTVADAVATLVEADVPGTAAAASAARPDPAERPEAAASAMAAAAAAAAAVPFARPQPRRPPAPRQSPP